MYSTICEDKDFNGIPMSSIIGLWYGVMNKDRLFAKWYIVTLVMGTACVLYAVVVIKPMYI